eukprot:165596-Hanusia_phi.AAC.1
MGDHEKDSDGLTIALKGETLHVVHSLFEVLYLVCRGNSVRMYMFRQPNLPESHAIAAIKIIHK